MRTPRLLGGFFTSTRLTRTDLTRYYSRAFGVVGMIEFIAGVALGGLAGFVTGVVTVVVYIVRRIADSEERG